MKLKGKVYKSGQTSSVVWCRDLGNNEETRSTTRSVARCSSAVECRTRNQVSPGSNPALLPFRRLGIFVLSIDAPVDSAV